MTAYLDRNIDKAFVFNELNIFRKEEYIFLFQKFHVLCVTNGIHQKYLRIVCITMIQNELMNSIGVYQKKQDMIIIWRLWSLPNRPLTTGLKNKLKATFEIEQCWIFAVLWWPFWKWRPVEIFRYRESIQDVEFEQCWICAVLWWPFLKWHGDR